MRPSGAMPIGRAGGALVLVGLALAPAAAQMNTGGLGGVVRDESGGVLPGAAVTASHADSGLTLARVSDAEGRFFLSSLPIGEWDVAVELPGFRRSVQTGIVLDVGRTIELRYTLEVGRIAEAVTVTAPAQLLQTATAEIGDVIETRRVERIPLNGRQFLQLAQLSQAVVIPPSGTRGAALQQAGPLPNVGGQRAGHNIYLLDGVKVTDELFNNLVINPSVDSISEVRVQQSMYPPEFGGKASALINVATRSGYNAVQRRRVRLRAQRAVRRAQLLRPARRAGAAARPAPVRRDRRRAARPRPHLLLRELRAAADRPLAHPHVLCSVGRGARRRLLGVGPAVRPAQPRSGDRRVRQLLPPATGYRRRGSTRSPRRFSTARRCPRGRARCRT